MEKVEETLEEYQYIRVLGIRAEIYGDYELNTAVPSWRWRQSLNVLNSEFSLQYDRNPFESIKTRLKSPRSIIEKLRRRGFSLADGNVEELVEENLYDVAGVRVICAFQEDIYRLADLLLQQDDIRLIRTKDYIKNPKPNGYRSLHLILEVPVFLEKGKTPVKIEVQFRTIAMDFWASVDHKLRYKKNVEDEEKIVEKLRQCAETISTLDDEMQRIRNMIEAGGERHVKD